MKKIAIFAEGQSEQIFVRNMLLRLVNNAHLSFECLNLMAGRLLSVPFTFSSPSAIIHVMIINVGNDESVTGVIREREEGLFSQGYERIVGLRDMYCAAYDRRSGGEIRTDVSREIEEGIVQAIRQMSEPEKISVVFEKMEFEAWILAMYDLFVKVDARLTADNINSEMDIDLRNIDPQEIFYRPSFILKRILAMAGIEYKKSFSDIERLCATMDPSDFERAIEGGRCDNFREFYAEIRAYSAES